MVQSLPGFLNLSLNVYSPSRVLGDVFTEVLEAAHPLHRGPTDYKRRGEIISQWWDSPPLPSILLANVQSLVNKMDDLRARISFQRDIRD